MTATSVRREIIGTIPPGSAPTRVSACSDGESVWVELKRGLDRPQQFDLAQARLASELLFRAAQAAEAVRKELA